MPRSSRIINALLKSWLSLWAPIKCNSVGISSIGVLEHNHSANWEYQLNWRLA